MSFVKLPLNIAIPTISESDIKLIFTDGGYKRGKNIYAAGSNKKESTAQMYSVPDWFVKKIINQLPENLIKKEFPTVYVMKVVREESNRLPPHIDRGRRAAINIYLRCNNERTVFYSRKNEELIEQCAYVAKSGETWLLDVSTPHAVFFGDGKERFIVSIGFRKTRFENLKKEFTRG